jgi:polyhydroxyalkanoate synthase
VRQTLLGCGDNGGKTPHQQRIQAHRKMAKSKHPTERNQTLKPPAIQPATRPPRLGPRPLPLHLMTAAATWTSCTIASTNLNDAWPILQPPQSGDQNDPLADLKTAIAQIVDKDAAGTIINPFTLAVAQAAAQRMSDLLAAILAYRRHPYHRPASAAPIIWQEGNSVLTDHAPGTQGPVVLLIPSLVNRSYILDLRTDHSFAGWLAAAGFRPLVLDWGCPGDIERNFTLTDYIAGRLDRALNHACALAAGPVSVLGYCMGGNLALALAGRRGRDIAALATIATPWDFSADAPPGSAHIDLLQPQIEMLLRQYDGLPVDMIQALFHNLDPMLVMRKFLKFHQLEEDSPAATAFVALEDWLNDGVPVVQAVARECLLGWYGKNQPFHGEWQVAGQAVAPASIRCPSLLTIPAADRIVPPKSALALAAIMPHATVLRPALGHVGMMSSQQAISEVWQPIADWLRQNVG